jgi:glycosyltransferase involved in cell wall biosynthesis
MMHQPAEIGVRPPSIDQGAQPAPEGRRRSVLFVFRRGRAERLERMRAGEGPDEMVYGLNHLDPERYACGFIEASDERPDWWRRLWRLIERLIARCVGMGFVLPVPLTHRGALETSDVIVSTVDACGLPLAMLKWLGWLDTPLIYISQGLSDRLRARRWRAAPFRALYTRWLRCAERVIVLGEGARQPLIDTLGLDPGRVFCLPFGIDSAFWTPSRNAPGGGYVLSVGSDGARDYATLLRARPRLPLKIVTRLPLPAALLAPSVEVASAISDVELRELYRRAAFVVTPLQDVDQPSGQSATLQAMACGKAVILTRTRGLWEPQRMRHLDVCYLVEPHDVRGLQSAMEYLTARPDEAERIGDNARRLVEAHYHSRRFAADLQRHAAAVLPQRSPATDG